jgi:hypothetical protein
MGLSNENNLRAEAVKTSEAFRKKADHNKNEALRCFIVALSCSLAAPLFVTLGQSVLWAKVVPSVLSLLAAGSTTWLQLRKPQQLWALYRDCQRRVEYQLRLFDHKLTKEYETEPIRTKTLAQHLADLELEAHQKWLDIVPNTHSLTHLASKEHK